MKEIKFFSVYAPQIKKFIDFKRSLNYKYKREMWFFLDIDLVAVENNVASPGITDDFTFQCIHAWKNKSSGLRYDLMRVLAEFSRFLNDEGIPSYVPKLPKYRKNTFVPHVYPPAEISKIFEATNNLRPSPHRYRSAVILIPALFRFLYATGVRIGEVLSLKNEDVDLTKNNVRVVDSKNKSIRNIPISDSLSAVLKQYVTYRDLLISPKSNFFFCNYRGNKSSMAVPGVWLRKCLSMCGIRYLGPGKGPRVHDFRHTFACTSLAKVVKDGVDIYSRILLVGAYLGQKEPRSINRYIRLTEAMFPELRMRLKKSGLDIFPKRNSREEEK